MEDLAFAGVVRNAAALRAREVSAPELVDLFLERIDRLGPRLNCFTGVLADEARAAAAAAQARLDRGEAAPLLGCPVAVKDDTPLAGRPTTYGTRAHDGRPAPQDGLAIARLRAAGAVVVATTTLPELAQFGHMTASRGWGVTRNPWDTARSPGGSSGGSAAAVAGGLSAGALGSDGGCSVRVPAAFCGLVGLKPQRGRVPLTPAADYWHGLGVLGPIARTVPDAALLTDVLTDSDEFARAAAGGPGRLRVAVSLKPALPTRVHPAHRRAVEETAALLSDLGHHVASRDPRIPVMGDVALPRYLCGIADSAEPLPHPERLERRTRVQVALGRRIPRALLARAKRREASVAAQLNEVLRDHDVLLTPVTAAPAPRAEVSVGHGALRTTWIDMAPHMVFTAPWSVTGQPAISVPAGLDGDGMPTAVQLVGRPHAEATLLALAAQIEAARPWAHLRPPLTGPGG